MRRLERDNSRNTVSGGNVGVLKDIALRRTESDWILTTLKDPVQNYLLIRLIYPHQMVYRGLESGMTRSQYKIPFRLP